VEGFSSDHAYQYPLFFFVFFPCLRCFLVFSLEVKYSLEIVKLHHNTGHSKRSELLSFKTEVLPCPQQEGQPQEPSGSFLAPKERAGIELGSIYPFFGCFFGCPGYFILSELTWVV